ncbi:MAG TPA: transcriptional repressor [Peptococcaceae bacterium]|nr:transcriptional repressor [Peptococcaceae bacterium]
MTRQKKIILDVLKAVNTHPTAEWIYQEAKQQIPGLSLGTVYRNLNLLRDNGEIMELNYGSSQSHFDGNAANHYHFQCRNCGEVFDLELPLIKNIETKASGVDGHKIEGHRLEFYGLCKTCLSRQAWE